MSRVQRECRGIVEACFTRSFVFSSRSNIRSTSSSYFAFARTTARMARCADERGMPVRLEMERTLRPRLIISATAKRRRMVSVRVPGFVPLAVPAFWGARRAGARRMRASCVRWGGAFARRRASFAQQAERRRFRPAPAAARPFGS